MFINLLRTRNIDVSYCIKRFYNCNNAQILCDYFGMSLEEANIYVKHHRLKAPPERLMETIKMCKKFNYCNTSIIKNPILLRKHAQTLDQQYHLMEEGGFYNIDAVTLAKYNSLSKKKIVTLKSLNKIKSHTNVLDEFMKYVDPVPKDFNLPPYDEHLYWNSLQMSILKEYLRNVLEATDDEIINFFRIHKNIKNKSFRIIKENLDLALELNFSPSKILKHGYILSSYPEYLKESLRDFPNLAGADFKYAIWLYPKLFMTSPKSILKIYGILKEYNIPDETIRKSMNIFHLSPETVKLRLDEIKSVPELNVLFRHPHILRLLVHQNRARSRLSFLQNLQLKCSGYSLLGTLYNFDNYIREGKDINYPDDLKKYFKNLFGSTWKNTWKKFKQHPYHLCVPLVNMERNYRHLRNLNFKTEIIQKLMHVILYSTESIDRALKEIEHDKYLEGKKLTDYQRLSLIIYYIEKDYHFTGNGIWENYEVGKVPEKVLE